MGKSEKNVEKKKKKRGKLRKQSNFNCTPSSSRPETRASEGFHGDETVSRSNRLDGIHHDILHEGQIGQPRATQGLPARSWPRLFFSEKEWREPTLPHSRPSVGLIGTTNLAPAAAGPRFQCLQVCNFKAPSLLQTASGCQGPSRCLICEGFFTVIFELIESPLLHCSCKSQYESR